MYSIGLKQDFIFIHIPKTGGTSVKDCLIRNYPKENLFYTDYGYHAPIGEYVKAIENNPDCKPMSEYVIFTTVRNPWDRVVSRYFFAKKVIEVEKKQKQDYADTSTFEAFLEERHKWGDKEYMWHRAVRGWYPAVDHVTESKGKLKCDMLRLEHLNKDLIAYFKIPMMSRPRNVTAMNKGTYKDMYNKETIQIIADWYKKDIDMWGFDFDSGPTKNYWRLDNE